MTIRVATPGDLPRLQRLAELDSSRLPAGPMLVAEVGEQLPAAYSVAERRPIADPFRRTAELVDLLAMRARQRGRGRGRRRGRRRRRSTAPQPPGLGVGFPHPSLDRRTT